MQPQKSEDPRQLCRKILKAVIPARFHNLLRALVIGYRLPVVQHFVTGLNQYQVTIGVAQCRRLDRPQLRNVAVVDMKLLTTVGINIAAEEMGPRAGRAAPTG